MASTCLPSGKCGTVVTGWLQTAHPKTADGIVSGKVCFRWGSDCCNWSQNIHLRNCGRFFVYKLGKTFACPMGFCGITSSRSGRLHNFYITVFIYHNSPINAIANIQSFNSPLFVTTPSVTDNVISRVKMLTPRRTRGVSNHPLPHLARFFHSF